MIFTSKKGNWLNMNIFDLQCYFDLFSMKTSSQLVGQSGIKMPVNRVIFIRIFLCLLFKREWGDLSKKEGDCLLWGQTCMKNVLEFLVVWTLDVVRSSIIITATLKFTLRPPKLSSTVSVPPPLKIKFNQNLLF